jgi:hypothetical protein
VSFKPMVWENENGIDWAKLKFIGSFEMIGFDK